MKHLCFSQAMLTASLLKKLSLVKTHCVPEAGISITSNLPQIPTSCCSLMFHAYVALTSLTAAN